MHSIFSRYRSELDLPDHLQYQLDYIRLERSPIIQRFQNLYDVSLISDDVLLCAQRCAMMMILLDDATTGQLTPAGAADYLRCEWLLIFHLKTLPGPCKLPLDGPISFALQQICAHITSEYCTPHVC